MVSTSAVRNGIVNYVNANILPKMEPTKQFLAGTVVGLIASRIDPMMVELAGHPLVKPLGLIGENGSVDLDALREAAARQMDAQGSLSIDIPFVGKLTFTAADVQELYETIRRA